MSAVVAGITVKYGLRAFHCPACGTQLLDEEDGISEMGCAHWVGTVDWFGEFISGPQQADLAQRVSAAYDEIEGSTDDLLKIIAGPLPRSAVVMEFFEPSRGGGHDATAVIFIIDFPTN